MCSSCSACFWEGEELVAHHEETGHRLQVLVGEETGEAGRQGELLDVLREARREGVGGCMGCVRHSEGLQRHLERHVEGLKIRSKKEVVGSTVDSAEVEDTGFRETRRMKRGKSVGEPSEDIKEDKKIKIEDANTCLASPPLRLKIKLTPEIARSLDSSLPSPPRLPPLVESLGVDVPAPHHLALLNRLHHAPDALARGSVLRRPDSRPGYTCSVCGKREVVRVKFQEHILRHSTEGSAQCKECGASFAVEPSWRKHLLLIHGVRLPGLEDLCQDLVAEEDMEDEEDEEGELVIDTGEEEEEGQCGGR